MLIFFMAGEWHEGKERRYPHMDSIPLMELFFAFEGQLGRFSGIFRKWAEILEGRGGRFVGARQFSAAIKFFPGCADVLTVKLHP
jgi:hypothetical protein